MTTAEQVYNELYPTYDQVRLEVIRNPNRRKKHVLSKRHCQTHKVQLRIYFTIMRGKPYNKYICPVCQKEKKRERWKNKIKQALG